MLELLVIEDVESDFLLIDRHLRLNGLAAHCTRVAGSDELAAALDRGGWDAVLSDYRVPGMEFRQTLAMILVRLPDVPVILVSGSVGEEEAVDLLKRGLSDFILKDRLLRLVPAIERSLKDAEDRRARRGAEQALRESEARANLILDTAPDAMLVVDGAGNIVRANARAGALLGYVPDDLVGLTVESFVPERFRVEHGELRRAFAAQPAVRPMGRGRQLFALRRDGSEFPAEISLGPVQIGGALHVIVNLADITERQRTEAALRRSELLTRSVMDSLRSAIAVLDGRGRIIHVNAAWQEFASANGANEVTTRGVGLNYLDACRGLGADDVATRALAGIGRVLGGDEPFFTIEYPCHSPAQQRWFEMKVSPLQGPDGGVVVSHADISVRKLAEIALRESEAMLARAQSMARVGGWSADLVDGTVTASEEGARLVGWAPGVHLAEELFAILHLDDRAAMRTAWQQALRSGGYDMEHRILLDGAVRWLHVKAEIVYDQEGRPVKAVGMSQDVTEAREAQQALQAHKTHLEELVALRTAAVREAESRFRGLVEQALAGIYIIQGGYFRYVNPAFATVLGYGSPEEIVDRISVLDLVAPEDRDTVRRNVKARESGTADGIQYEFTALRKDGTRMNVEVYGRAIVHDGRPAVIGLLLDVTQRKAAERAQAEALAEARRLAAVRSEFLANMSHEIRTPLNAVLGLAQVGMRDSVGRRAQHTFHRILDSGQLLLGIVNDVLDFSKIEAGKLELERAPFDLGMAIDRAVHLSAAAAFDKGLAFNVHEAADLPQRCQGDALRLSQVLVNLLSNAVKFTERGHVDLAVCREGDELVLRVADSGIGMGEDQVARLFQPFEQADGSTTRRFGGTGLGLAISKRLVDMMGGSIHVDSRLDDGACFTVRLPLAGASAPVVADGERIVLAGLPAPEADRVRRALESIGAGVAVMAPDEALATEAALVALDARVLDKTRLDRAGERAASGRRLALIATPGLSESVPLSLREQVQLIERPLRARQLLAACRATAPGQEAPALASRLAGVRVLAVEDNEVNRLVLEEILEREGAQLSLAHDGRQALTRIEREGGSAFDIVLTDIQMPGIDGYETARRILALDANLPVIGLTAHAMPEERARCLAAGMVEHIAKPVDIDALVAAILRRRRHAGGEGAVAAAPAPSAAQDGATVPADAALIDRIALSARYKNKQAFIDRLLITAAETHAETPARLRQAIVEQDLDTLVFIAHKLKGSAGNLVAVRLQALAAATEEAARAARPDAWQLAEQLSQAVEALLGELVGRDAPATVGNTP